MKSMTMTARPTLRANLLMLAALPLALTASSCSEDAEAARHLPPVVGARLDAELQPAALESVPQDAATDDQAPQETASGAAMDAPDAATPSSDAQEALGPAADEATIVLTFLDLLLDDETKEDLLDALIYPDEYTDEERAFPPDIARLDGKHVSVTGYMIPTLWNETKVTEFMLVGDLLACCFGGAPEPDEWLSAVCEDGFEAEYYPFVPVIVTGTFKIEGIEDDAGYAAGAYHMIVDSVEKEL